MAVSEWIRNLFGYPLWIPQAERDSFTILGIPQYIWG
jgi:hypothetical protein